MGEQLSSLGYVVLAPDFYYRNGPYDPIEMRTAFSTKETAEKIMSMMRGYPQTSWCATPAPSSTTSTHCPRRSRAESALPATPWAPALAHHRCKTGRAHCCGGLLPLREPGQRQTTLPTPSQGQRHQGRRVRGGGDRGPVIHRRAEGSAGEVPERGRGQPHPIETSQARHGFAVPDNASYDADAAGRHWKAMEHFFGSVLGL